MTYTLFRRAIRTRQLRAMGGVDRSIFNNARPGQRSMIICALLDISTAETLLSGIDRRSYLERDRR